MHFILSMSISKHGVPSERAFRYHLTAAEHRETNFINLYTIVLSTYSKIAMLELNGFKILVWVFFARILIEVKS